MWIPCSWALKMWSRSKSGKHSAFKKFLSGSFIFVCGETSDPKNFNTWWNILSGYINFLDIIYLYHNLLYTRKYTNLKYQIGNYLEMVWDGASSHREAEGVLNFIYHGEDSVEEATQRVYNSPQFTYILGRKIWLSCSCIPHPSSNVGYLGLGMMQWGN